MGFSGLGVSDVGFGGVAERELRMMSLALP